MKKVVLVVLLIVVIASITLLALTYGHNETLISPSGDNGGRTLILQVLNTVS